MTTEISPSRVPSTDGRRARRERGRVAVSEAMIDLVFEGNLPPSANQVAERAGVSIASLFRYFETLDDLRTEATEIYFERHGHLFDIDDIGEGSLHRRIDNFVRSRATLYETTEPMARLLRIRANEMDGANDLLQRVRATRADQVRHHFDHELRAMTNAVRDDLVAIIVTMTSFESWDQMRSGHGRTNRQIRRAWSAALDQLLDAGRRPGPAS